jgi:uncharacterized membrane protein
MQDIVFFLGRFHVLALHLPIGMLCAAVAVDWLARKRPALDPAVPFLWGATAASAVLTVTLGYMHFAEGGFSGPSAAAHRLYGTLVAVACVAVWLFSAKRPVLHRRLNVVTGLAVLTLVTLTGHYGGNLTHGADYLVEYAPQSLRALAGLPARRARVADLASADPWHDVVHPILQARCANCHNDDKRSGELSMADYAATRAGGENGSVIVPGKPELSELYRRITLPRDDEAFMPAEGKTPLTERQTEILRWWIATGAPADTPMADIETPDDIIQLLRLELELDGPASSTAAPVAMADAGLLESLSSAGFLARPVSQTDPRLIVSVYSVGTELGDEQLATLWTAGAQVSSLDLQDAGIDDSDLEGIAALAELHSLRLSRNQVTDAGVRTLTQLPRLEVLNVYGNGGIGDAAVETLAAMRALSAVYLWETGVTPEGAARLMDARPDLAVTLGASPFVISSSAPE